jgi:hypothetical protein
MRRTVADDFEPWLERELRRTIEPVRGPRPHAVQAAYRAVAARRDPLAAVGARAAAAIVAVGLAVGGGLSGAAAVTGTPIPASWGELVAQAVTSCRDQAPREPSPATEAGDARRCVIALTGQWGETLVPDRPADVAPAHGPSTPAAPQAGPAPGEGEDTPKPAPSGGKQVDGEAQTSGGETGQSGESGQAGETGESGQAGETGGSGQAGETGGSGQLGGDRTTGQGRRPSDQDKRTRGALPTIAPDQ